MVGADASRGRWLAIKLSEDGSWEINLVRNIAEMWESYSRASSILIDVPIGLREQGDKGRLCDMEARKRIGARRSSVFRAPCRAALRAENYEDAKRISREKTGKSLSIQSWGIIPKVREVDEFLNENALAEHRAVNHFTRKTPRIFFRVPRNSEESLSSQERRDCRRQSIKYSTWSHA